MGERNYWGYRINKNEIDYFRKELNEGRLRQGWGLDKGQDLRNQTVNLGANRNRPIFDRVKKGDILLVPRLPKWEEVAIVEATADFDEGYRFEIDETKRDFGHIFPAKLIKSFVRHCKYSNGNIRSTLRCAMRFWNINQNKECIEELLKKSDGELLIHEGHYSKLISSITESFNKSFDEEKFKEGLRERLNEKFHASEWEYLLVEGLKKLFPTYEVERVGGKSEKKHGTDILIRIPSIIAEYQYAIAIQVKDHDCVIDKSVLEQINKAKYWDVEDNTKLIDKIVIVTKAKRKDNEKLLEGDKNRSDREVKFIFAEELNELLSKIAKSVIGIKEDIE